MTGTPASSGMSRTAGSLERLIFVRRQSPDWESLTRDYEAGQTIDPGRYVPGSEIPGFPDDITACIRAWNERFWLNFFRCRLTLKQISGNLLRQVPNSIVISEDRLKDVPALTDGARCLLFFFDDDDWFAPDMFARLAPLDPDRFDIAVFPLPRLGDEVFTFVREGEPARATAGARRNFDFRFQTNNYGISSRIAAQEALGGLRDHVLGSEYADRTGLGDSYFDIVISATNKTPCSANIIGQLLVDPAGYRDLARRYVDALTDCRIPPELDWMTEPIKETIALFRTL